MKHLIGKPITFQQGDRLFDAMWQVLQLLGSLATAQSSTDPEIPKLDEYQVVSPRFRTVLRMPISNVVEYSLHNIVPASIGFRVADPPEQLKNDILDPVPIGLSHQISDLNDLCASVVFVNFYEIHKPFIKTHWGENPRKWPDAFNFARVMRNCVSHSGAINIAAKTPGAAWRKFSYARADDGRRVIGTEIFSVDLIYLMFDLSAALDAVGAPVFAVSRIAR